MATDRAGCSNRACLAAILFQIYCMGVPLITCPKCSVHLINRAKLVSHTKWKVDLWSIRADGRTHVRTRQNQPLKTGQRQKNPKNSCKCKSHSIQIIFKKIYRSMLTHKFHLFTHFVEFSQKPNLIAIWWCVCVFSCKWIRIHFDFLAWSLSNNNSHIIERWSPSELICWAVNQIHTFALAPFDLPSPSEFTMRCDTALKYTLVSLFGRIIWKSWQRQCCQHSLRRSRERKKNFKQNES